MAHRPFLIKLLRQKKQEAASVPLKVPVAADAFPMSPKVVDRVMKDMGSL